MVKLRFSIFSTPVGMAMYYHFKESILEIKHSQQLVNKKGFFSNISFNTIKLLSIRLVKYKNWKTVFFF